MSQLSDRAVVNLQALIDEAPELHDRYSVSELIGRGGMGVVYRAHDRLLAREVALKVLETRAPAALNASVRLQREAAILARLEHPGIVPVHDVGTLSNGATFYVMRLVRGVRLDEYVRKPLRRGELLRIMLRLCDAVAFANAQGVVHRDLKPGNIMIGPFGDVLVLDWGIAKVRADSEFHSRDNAAAIMDDKSVNTASTPVPEQASTRTPSRPQMFPQHDASLTGEGMVVGTPGYMAPEQEAGESSAVTQTADVYGLGIIMRELLENATERPDRALDAVTMRATALVPAQRYPSAEVLADDIRQWLDGRPVSAYQENVFERILRAYRQHQVAVWLVSAYLAVRITVLLWRHI